MTLNPDHRLNVDEALKHPWVVDMEKKLALKESSSNSSMPQAIVCDVGDSHSSIVIPTSPVEDTTTSKGVEDATQDCVVLANTPQEVNSCMCVLDSSTAQQRY